MNFQRTQGDDIGQGGEINLHFFVRGGDHGRTSYRHMRRLIRGLTNLTLPNHIAYATHKVLMTISRIDQDALSLVGPRMAQLPMKLFGNFPRVPCASILGILGRRRLTNVGNTRSVEMARPILRGPKADASIRHARTQRFMIRGEPRH